MPIIGIYRNQSQGQIVDLQFNFSIITIGTHCSNSKVFDFSGHSSGCVRCLIKNSWHHHGKH